MSGWLYCSVIFLVVHGLLSPAQPGPSVVICRPRGTRAVHIVPPPLRRNNNPATKVPQRSSGTPGCRVRKGMEESYETFEEELGPPGEDPPPQKPVRQTRQPEMYVSRKVREEMSAVPPPPKVEPKTLHMDPRAPRKFPVQKALSMQNLSQIETPWENVTLNRCLFVAITILVLTSGCQRLHETLRGRGAAEEEDEEVELIVRHPTTLRHRGKPPQPETTLWEVLFWWLPDLNDEDDGKRKRGAPNQSLRGLRNRPVPDKKLTKQREGTLQTRRAKKAREQHAKDKKKKEILKTPDKAEDEKLENEPLVSNIMRENKETKKKIQKEQF
ncbi:uncharacterized protein LOC133511015 [Syngnathoides biaculeatus]|uniref:uncharacterized protein LOC133511015 n=1 Tax=Syngnathoides biaculeatus TaxID=300417 RepID=UPI002ADDD76F|nr:uncharacterized protein LOC133511015 [Syngnathoides biaculeatus]